MRKPSVREPGEQMLSVSVRPRVAVLGSGLGWHTLGLTGVVSGDDVAKGRPAPDLILAAMSAAGEGDPKAVLAAGDTVSDLQAAAAAGVGWSVGVMGDGS